MNSYNYRGKAVIMGSAAGCSLYVGEDREVMVKNWKLSGDDLTSLTVLSIIFLSQLPITIFAKLPSSENL